jgi:F0F1-type ATP synthase delta subunit
MSKYCGESDNEALPDILGENRFVFSLFLGQINQNLVEYLSVLSSSPNCKMERLFGHIMSIKKQVFLMVLQKGHFWVYLSSLLLLLLYNNRSILFSQISIKKFDFFF